MWDNLQRSVTERIGRHQIALDTLRQLQQTHNHDLAHLESVDLLIKAKEAMNRSQDQAAVTQLQAILNLRDQ